MPDWSQQGDGQRILNAGVNAALSRGTSVTASGTANTKGAYAQLTASTTHDADVLVVMFDDIAAGVDYLVDIAIGAAAAEQVIAPNLYVGGGTGSLNYGSPYFLPINVPAGQRVSARCQASTLSSVVRVSCLLCSDGFNATPGLELITAYGANTATSGGVSVDPGTVANTKGAYSQIVAATTFPISMLTLAFGNQKNTARSSQSWLADFAIGAAGSETIVIPDIALNASTSPDIVTPQVFGPLPMAIPVGTRLAMRSQSDVVTATVRLWDIIAYGVC